MIDDNFEQAINGFILEIETKEEAVFLATVAAVHESITVGSPETGAPGQPVDTGNLRASFQPKFLGPRQAEVASNVVYAPFIEEGVVPLGNRRGNATGRSKLRLTLRSAVGGFHSIKLTVAGFPRLVAHVVAQLGGGR